jgi:CBS domain-containing protein
MRVEEICTRPAKSCSVQTSLAEAATILWDAGCGSLPVVDEVGKVVGLVADRDIGLAVAVVAGPAAEVPVRVVFHPAPATCRDSEDVRDALCTMRTRKVRRLPVVDGAGILCGMLSFTDVALAARPEHLAAPGDVTDEDVVLALKSIGAARRSGHGEVPAPQSGALV